MQYLVKVPILSLIWLMILVSCETKEYALPDRPKQIESSTDIVGRISFAGLTPGSITCDDYSATLSWEHVEGAGGYKILDVTNGGGTIIAAVNAPTDSFTVKGLDANTNYSFKVVAQEQAPILYDEDGNVVNQYDGNGNIILYDENGDLLPQYDENGYIINSGPVYFDSDSYERGYFINNDSVESCTTSSQPDRPSYMLRTIPNYAQTAGEENRPSFYILGMREGDTVILYSDSCNTEVARGVATSNYIVLQSDELTLEQSYTFRAKVMNPKGETSGCSLVSAAYTYQLCPPGYVRVPASIDVGTQEFCVMQYEAKAWYDSNNDGEISSSSEVDSYSGCYDSSCSQKWGSTIRKPGSGPYGSPWRMIDAYTAKAKCKELGDKYDLISNQEWMAIARDAEEQASNWSGGVVGQGCVNRGNTGTDDACSYGYSTNALDTGAGYSSATLTLSNTKEIYHLAGNVFEWIDMGKVDDLTLAPQTCESEMVDVEAADNFCSGQFLPDDYQTDNAGSLTFTTYGYTYSISADSTGNIYVATDGGIAKSTNSGGNFTNITALNGLPKNNITGGIAINSSGHIFVGTSLGLAKSTNSGASFSLLTTTTNPNLGSNNINDVFIDGSDNLYVATTGGLSFSNNSGTSFTNYTNASGNLAHDNALTVYVDGTNVLVGTPSGLSVTDDLGTTNFTTFNTGSGLAANRVETIYASGTKLYVGTQSGLSLSTDFDGSVPSASFTNKTTSNGLGSNYIWDIAVNSDGDIFIATEEGLAYTTNGGTTIYNRTTTHGLAENSVNGLYIDDDDNIYAATDAGISISTDNASSFTSKGESDGVGGEVTVGLGKISGGMGGAAYRGGSSKAGVYSGIYSLNLSSYPHQGLDDVGFRCVYRP